MVKINVNDVLKMYSGPTGYEKKKDLKNDKWELFEDYGDVKFYINRKSDRTCTLLVVFRSSISKDSWCGWMPNGWQCSVMMRKFPSVVERVNEYNIMIKNGW